jgi:hypothetical protein
MTKSVLFGAAALALTVMAAEAAEDVSSANYMMPGCRKFVTYQMVDTDSLVKGFYCAGIVTGIVFMGQFAKIDMNLCLDLPRVGVVTTDQITKVVIAYIEARPARMHEDFRQLALEALRTAWPCPPRDYPPISLPPVIVPDLLHNEAMALAQLVKRLGHDDVERLSSRFDGGHERNLMLAGIDKLQRALAEAGFAPR